MLSAGLVIGSSGGAIAVADTDAESSTGSSQTAETPSGTAPSGTARPTRGPIATIADSLRKAVQDSWQSTVQGVTGTLNDLPKPGALPPAIPAPPKTTFGGTPTVYGSTGFSSPVSESVPPVSGSNVTPPSTTVPSVPAYVAPNPIMAVSNAFAPVSNSFTAVANTVVAFPAVVASLPTSTAPLTDVLTSLQNVLASVADAGVSLSQLPSDLSGLLGVSATAPMPTIGASTGMPQLAAATSTPVTTTPGWSALPQLISLPSVESGPVVDTFPAPVTPLDVTTTGVLRGESGTGSALVVSKGAGTNDVLSTVQHVIGAFVATVSLAALAAIALPGIIGLLTTCAAGIRVGYRQAKAGSVLPNTVVSRFVGSGPVGVVRSGGQVELRSRASRVTRTVSREEVPTRALRVVRSESSSRALLLDRAV